MVILCNDNYYISTAKDFRVNPYEKKFIFSPWTTLQSKITEVRSESTEVI